MTTYHMLGAVAIRPDAQEDALARLGRMDPSGAAPSPGEEWLATLETTLGPHPLAQLVAQVAEDGEVLALFLEDHTELYAFLLEGNQARPLKVVAVHEGDGRTWPLS